MFWRRADHQTTLCKHQRTKNLNVLHRILNFLNPYLLLNMKGIQVKKVQN